MKGQWTHLALPLPNLESSIAFYARCTILRPINRRSDASSTGMEVIWLTGW